MLKEKALPVAIFGLAISIIISAVIVGNGLKGGGDSIFTGLSAVSQGISSAASSNGNTDNVVYTRNTYDLPAASAYLGISEVQLIDLVNASDSGIPYIKIGSAYIFSKSALDKWMETARVEIK